MLAGVVVGLGAAQHGPGAMAMATPSLEGATEVSHTATVFLQASPCDGKLVLGHKVTGEIAHISVDNAIFYGDGGFAYLHGATSGAAPCKHGSCCDGDIVGAVVALAAVNFTHAGWASLSLVRRCLCQAACCYHGKEGGCACRHCLVILAFGRTRCTHITLNVAASHMATEPAWPYRHVSNLRLGLQCIGTRFASCVGVWHLL